MREKKRNEKQVQIGITLLSARMHCCLECGFLTLKNFARVELPMKSQKKRRSGGTEDRAPNAQITPGILVFAQSRFSRFFDLASGIRRPLCPASPWLRILSLVRRPFNGAFLPSHGPKIPYLISWTNVHPQLLWIQFTLRELDKLIPPLLLTVISSSP